MSRLAALALLLLAACGGNPTPQPPGPSGWSNFTKGGSVAISNPFAFPSASQAPLGYIYKKPPSSVLRIGQTITLNYSIAGNATFGVTDPADAPPATIHLFIWETGDDLTGVNQYAYYRWWCRTPAVLNIGDNRTLSCTINETWTSVYDAAASAGALPAQGFAQALNNVFAVGFTFGGQSFYGHGGYAIGNATFTIDSFTVQ